MTFQWSSIDFKIQSHNLQRGHDNDTTWAHKVKDEAPYNLRDLNVVCYSFIIKNRKIINVENLKVITIVYNLIYKYFT